MTDVLVGQSSERGKDWHITLFIGILTAFFLHIIFVNTDVRLSWKGFTLPFIALYVILPLAETVGYFLASRLFSHLLILKQGGRFAIVGLLNFAVDTGILSVLSRITGIYSGSGIFPLNTVSTVIAIANSYYWNRTWTFKEKISASREEFFAFLTVTVVGIVLNGSIVYALTTYIEPFDGITMERLEVLAKVGATAISLFWNFLGYKFIVFKAARAV